MALSAPDTAPAVFVDGCTVAWTPEALTALADLRRDAAAVSDTKKSLPYASLRGLLEVYLHEVVRIDRRMGLNSYGLDPRRHGAPRPFLWTEGQLGPTKRGLQSVIEQWMPNYLVATYAGPARVGERHLERLDRLRQSQGLFSVTRFRSGILPWRWDSRTGTTGAEDEHGFCALADHAARCLAGKVVCPGLSPLRRIVVTGAASHASAELITDPIVVDGKCAFSLVVRLDVETMPGRHQPLLCVGLSKRRWLRKIDESAYGVRTITGFVFPRTPADRAFQFAVIRKHDRSAGHYYWPADNAFEALRQHLSLPLGKCDGEAIAGGGASSENARVLLTHRPAVADGGHGVKSGVPELDKLDAFEAVASALAQLGMKPVSLSGNLTARGTKVASSAAVAAPRPLAAAVLGLTGETEDEEDFDEGGDEAIDGPVRDLTAHDRIRADLIGRLSEPELDALLYDRLRIRLDTLHPADRSILAEEESDTEADASAAGQLRTLIEANCAAIADLYPRAKPRLVLVHDHGDSPESRLLHAVVRTLWGQALEVITQRLPRHTHGPRDSLPGASMKPTERARLRALQWEPLAKQIAADGRPTLCLIMAPRWFATPARGSDDIVNKPAARQVLAARGGATVQYLLPPNYDGDGGLYLKDFVYRSQAALRDLVWAHAGRVEGVRETVAQFFGPRPESPREIIGITIVCRNAGRSRVGLEPTFLPVAIRIDVASGRCEMRHAHQGRGGGLAISPWRPFSKALGAVADVSPVKLADERPERQTRFMRFCQQVIDESVEAGARPVVMIDSSNCVMLWPWLADRRISVSGIDIAQRQWAEEDWAGARIVRVRQGLAPSIVVDKTWQFEPASSSKGRGRPRTLRLPSPPFGGALFKLSNQTPSGCVTYLSVGGKRLHSNKRGISCYRTVTVADRTGSTEPNGTRKLFRLRQRAPTFDYWPSPNAIEIVVSLRNPGDDPDRIAQFIECLRHGFGHYCEWTSLPAPLFFERVVRNYVSGFSLVDDEEEED